MLDELIGADRHGRKGGLREHTVAGSLFMWPSL
jgi:hypothetical protein